MVNCIIFCCAGSIPACGVICCIKNIDTTNRIVSTCEGLARSWIHSHPACRSSMALASMV